MADRNDEVMQMVERELIQNPEIGLDVLFRRAREIDPAVGDLTMRQFHARYPLQVKRTRSEARRSKEGRPKRAKRSPRARRGQEEPRAARPAGGADSASAAGTASRESIRKLLIEFAGIVAGAQTGAEMVVVMSGLDRYVDRVEGLLSGGGGGAQADSGTPKRRRGKK